VATIYIIVRVKPTELVTKTPTSLAFLTECGVQHVHLTRKDDIAEGDIEDHSIYVTPSDLVHI
jgi:hypothetical protein